MVAHDVLGIVDHTTTIAGEHAAGIDGVRINMSHGTHEEKAADIESARLAAKKMGVPLAVLVDLSGPKIRTGKLKDGTPVILEAGAVFAITTAIIEGDSQKVSTNYPELPQVVHPGTRLLLDDGAIALTVETTTDTDVICRVIDGGVLGERKGINLPGVALPIDSLFPLPPANPHGRQGRAELRQIEGAHARARQEQDHV